jgi:hypothetical protein
MNTSNVISDALEYYDTNEEKYEETLKKIKYVKFVSETQSSLHNSIEFYDSNKKFLFKSRYENLGIYNNITHTWAWAWSLPHFRPISTSIIKKIVNYGIGLEPTMTFLKTQLTISRLRITSKVQIDIHASIASYLAKQPFIYKYKYYSSFVQEKDKLISLENFKNDDENRDQYIMYYMYLIDHETIKIDEVKNFLLGTM